MATELGVPGADGDGEEAIVGPVDSTEAWALWPNSGGAGLFEEILLAGRSILVNLPCCASVNWPSLFFNA